VIINFADKATEDLHNGYDTKAARRIPQSIWKAARLRLDAMDGAKKLQDLRFPPGNRLESLNGDLSGYHSIRINDQFRIIFRWVKGDIHDVEITDYHYGATHDSQEPPSDPSG
jgi:proteic killer suppression protein